MTIVILAVGGLTMTGCGHSSFGGDGDPRTTAKALVVLGSDDYRPPRVRIDVGSRVTFFNDSPVANTAETKGVGFFDVDRDQQDRDNEFDVHTLQPGEAESVEFDTPGTYRYHSSFDFAMRGVVEVVSPGSP